jgi:phosphopantetheinyl transferase (holo-ACP synthase)
MASLAVGVDIIEIERVKRVLQRFGERFLARIYLPWPRPRAGGSLRR